MGIIVRTDESYQKFASGCHLLSSKCDQHTPVPAEQQTDSCSCPPLQAAPCSQVLVREQLLSSDNETLSGESQIKLLSVMLHEYSFIRNEGCH